jgi:hypothetical protein
MATTKARKRSRSKSTEPPPPPPKSENDDDNNAKALLKLRQTAGKIQTAIDLCRHRILKSHVEFPNKETGVNVETLLEYARRVAYTTSAPLNYQPGVSQLCGQLPPAPQEEHFLVSQMKKRHEEKLVHEQALQRKRAREEETTKRQKEIEEMAKLSKEELIRRLVQWKPGAAWPAGVPKPPVGWKPGDPFAFLTTKAAPNAPGEASPLKRAAAEKQPEKQEEKQQKQLSLDFEEDEGEDGDDFDDDDAFDFDVVSASDGGDDDSD